MKKIQFIVKVLVIIVLCNIALFNLPSNSTGLVSTHSENIPMKSSSDDDLLVDKIYTFTVSNPILRFDNNLYFEKEYYYDIEVTVKSPHTISMEITLWDPEGDRYDLFFENNITQNVERVIPFGAALSGDYRMQFRAIISENLNVQITVRKAGRCLSSQIDSFGKDIYYNVSKFYSGTTVNFNLVLESDKNYRFYFHRVSPISKTSSNQIVMDHYFYDPQLIYFRTFTDISLANITHVKTYDFGSATPGLYMFTLKIFSEIICSNIAWAIVEEGKATNDIDPNNPEPLPDGVDLTNHTQSGVMYYIPPEWTVGVIIFVGVSVGVPIVLVISRKKKNSMKL